MLSIRLQSTFKYVLVGLVVFLLLATVEALPTKDRRVGAAKPAPRPHGKATVGAAARKRVSVNARHKPTKGAPSCPLRPPMSGLHKRANLEHPSAKNSVVLFHGTQSSAAAASMAARVDLAKTHNCGDFHHNRKHSSDGGAYFTDSIMAAAQFACYKDAYDPTLKVPDTVHVLAFSWTPGSYKVYEFKDWTSVTDTQCKAHDMITGPMEDTLTDGGLTKDFWQYAVVKNEAVAGLRHIHTYEAHCKHIPKGNALSSALYAQGQSGSPGFHQLAATIGSAAGC